MYDLAKKFLMKAPGWSTCGKLVVFQSDDWGSIRTTSREALSHLRKIGVDVDACHYMLFDTMERSNDLEGLFDVLNMVSDRNGRHPVFTTNCLIANPDFDRIRQAGFSEYFGESVTDTMSHTPGAERNMTLWQEGIAKGICQPQSHGREHLNIHRWMADLAKGDPIIRTAFDHRMCGVSSHTVSPRRKSYQAAFDTTASDGVETKSDIVSDALERFEDIYGFKSRSFVAPNYVWDYEIERVAKIYGVDYLQCSTLQWLPADNASGKKNTKWRFQGHKSASSQRYIVRNVHFEPSSDPSRDWVATTLKDIDLAFKLRKPAIISTHRVNFMGSLSQANRDRGLVQLQRLLREMLEHWPDIQFTDTVELGDRMSGIGIPG